MLGYVYDPVIEGMLCDNFDSIVSSSYYDSIIVDLKWECTPIKIISFFGAELVMNLLGQNLMTFDRLETRK